MTVEGQGAEPTPHRGDGANSKNLREKKAIVWLVAVRTEKQPPVKRRCNRRLRALHGPINLGTVGA